MSASEYYAHSTYPATRASLSSSAMRAELELIEAGFAKLPDLSGNGGKIVAVNAGATALEAVTTTGTGNAVRATSPTFAGATLFGDGTVGAPGIAFSGDTDCGLYRIGANNVGVAVNGAKVLDVGTAGLGITGTLSATGTSSLAGLTSTGNPVFGTGAGDPLVMIGGSTSSYTALRRAAATPDQIDAVLADQSAYAKFKALTFEAVNGQYKFPAVQNASADANTLDDYEEGTFTPTLVFGGASVGMTFSTQQGSYTKVGRKVSFRITLNLSAKGSSTGTATIGGLPFVPSAGVTYAAFSLVVSGMASITATAVAYGAGGASNINLVQGFNSGAVLTDANFLDTSLLMLSGTYEV